MLAARAQSRERFTKTGASTLGNVPCDVDGLRQQMQQNKDKRSDVTQEDQDFADWTQRQVQYSQLQERKQRLKEKQEKQALASTWSEQGKHTSSEWDLNDPSSRWKEKPLRTEENEGTLGPSSLLVFEGEDLNYAARTKKSLLENNAIIEQQIAEKKGTGDEDQKMDQENAAYQERWSNYLRKEEMQKQAQNRKLAYDLMEENQRLAREKAERNQFNKTKEAELDQLDLKSMYSSAMLAESPLQAQSSTNSNRKITSQWKGMSEEDKALIREEQKRQIEEKAARKAQEQEQERLEVEWQGQTDQYRLQLEQDYQQRMKNERMRTQEQWKEQAREKTKKAGG